MRSEDRDRLLVATARGVLRLLLKEGCVGDAPLTGSILEIQIALEEAQKADGRGTKPSARTLTFRDGADSTKPVDGPQQ